MSSSMFDLPIKGRFNANIERFGEALECRLGNYFLGPPQGIYTRMDLEPVLIQGKQYFTLDKNALSTPVTNLNDLTEEIYTDEGVRVIPKHYMLNKATCLSDYPFLPYRGIKIVVQALKCELFNNLHYTKVSECFISSIRTHLKSNVVEDDFALQLIESTCSRELRPLLEALDSFINGDDWHIYDVNSKGSNVEIIKYIDFRIYDWTNNNAREKL